MFRVHVSHLPALITLGFILSFILGTTPLALADDCTQKIDSKKVMIFVDLNSNIEEVHSAQRAACARGEKISVIPADFERRHQTALEMNQLERKLTAACGDQFRDQQATKLATAACKTAQKNYKAASDRANSQDLKIDDALRAELTKVKNAGARVPAFIISAHDGGGHFFGHSGSTDRSAIEKVFSEFPELMAGVQSIGLLGCYTTVPTQVMKWKGSFTGAKLVFGYEGSAPLGDKPAGQTYLEDILKQEKQITGAANDKLMESKLLESVRGIQMVNSAVYLQSAQCNQDGSKKEYYFRNEVKDGKKFKPFTLSDCDRAQLDIGKNYKLFQKYESGELAIPTDTSSGPLRDLYTFFRQNEQCFGQSHEHEILPSSEDVFNLLFFNSVKRNFARAFADEIKDTGAIIQAMTRDSVEKGLRSQLESTKKDLADAEADLALYNADPAKYRKNIEVELTTVNQQVAILDKEDPSLVNYDSRKAHSEADKKKFADFTQAHIRKWTLSGKLSHLDEGSYLELQKAEIKSKQKQIADSDLTISQSLQEFETGKKNFWLPTLENIKNKNRKEILEDIHALNLIGLSHMGGLQGFEKVVDFNFKMSNMLESFQEIPFDWHEDSEHPTQPQEQSGD